MARFGTGILGFIAVTDKRGQHALVAIRADQATNGFLLDVTRDTRQGRATFTVPVACDRDTLPSPAWLRGDCAQSEGTLVVNGTPVTVRLQWSEAHSGSAIVRIPGVTSCFLMRHDCNPWPIAAWVAIAVVAVSAAVIVTAVTGTSVKIQASTSGVSVEINPGEGGEGGEGEGGEGEEGEGGND